MKITPKLITRIALLAAISLILGKFLSFKIGEGEGGWGRLSFENLTVILAGYCYGILPGMLCGVVADIVGCILYGYAINPIITLGAAMVGAYAGLFGKKGVFKNANLFLSVTTAHIVGSMLIKSLGLHILPPFFSFAVLVWRIPMYILTGILEYVVLRILFCNKAFCNVLEK